MGRMENIKDFFGSALAGALAANLGCFAGGVVFSWASPMRPKLSSNDSTINPLLKPTTVLEDSLLASIILPGCLIGALSGGLSSRRIGKKKTLLLFGLPILIGHIFCIFSKNINIFLWARFLMGIGSGCQYTILSVYVSEIVTDKNRGAYGTLVSILGCSGNLFVYSLGPLISIKIFSMLNIIPLILYFGFFFFCAESPYELIENGDRKLAEKTLMRLRKTNTASALQKEIYMIEETVKQQTQSKGKFVDFFRDRTLRKTLFLTCSIFFFQQCSGIAPFLAYMQNIFESSKVGIPAQYSPVLVSVFALFANAASSLLIDKLGRKISLIISMSCLTFSNGTLGYFFYLRSINFDTSPISWLPVISVIVFFVFYALGLASVPYILIGEYFPASHKHLAVSITVFVSFFFCGIVTLSFPYLIILLGEAGTFWIFSTCLGVGVIFVILVMPETKGMSFTEVQYILSRENIK